MLKTSSQVGAIAPSVPADSHIATAARGGSIIFFGQLFEEGIRFGLGVLLARALGTTQYGLCSLALTAASMADAISRLGMRQAVVRYVSVAASRRDNKRLWGVLQIGIGLPFALSILSAVLLYVLAGPIAEQVFHKPALAPLLQVSCLAIPFLTLSEMIAAATRGFKRMRETALVRNMSFSILRLIFSVVLVFTVGLRASSALSSFNLAIIIIAVWLVFSLNAQFSLRRPWGEAQRDTKELLRFALPVYLSDLIETFGGSIKTLLLGALNTMTSVGVYSVAGQVNTLGRLFHGSVVTTSAPIVSELHDQGDRTKLHHFYQTMTKWTFMANLPLFLIVLLFPVQILAIFGEGFIQGAVVLVIIAWSNLVNTGTGICGLVIDMTGNTYLKMINSLVSFGLLVGLSFALIPRLGLIGAAVGSLAAAATVNLVRLVEVYVLFRMLPYNKSFLKPIAAGVISALAGWSMQHILPMWHYLIRLSILVSVVLGIYALVLLVLGLSDDDRDAIAHTLHRVSPALSDWVLSRDSHLLRRRSTHLTEE